MGNFFSSPAPVNPAPKCPTAPVCPTAPKCPTAPVCPTAPGCPTAQVCTVCPTAPGCPAAQVCPVCPTAPVCPVCPVAPVCPVCPAAPVCPDCPVCPAAPVCPVCPVCPKTIDFIGLDIDSDDSKIDILKNKKQVFLPSTNIPYNGLFNTPVSYISPLYGKPTFFYEAIKPIITASDILFNRITLVGATTLNTGYYNAVWNNRYMFGITSPNNTNTNTKPTNYIVLKLPIDPTTHNTIFIQAIAIDRWSNINMYICNNSTKIPEKKIFTNCNSGRGGNGNSSFLGPMNNVALQGGHEWIGFSLSIDTIDTYKTSSNEIFVSINPGINNEHGEIWMTGVAVVPNNYAVTTMRGVNLCWNSNNNTFTKQTNGTWLLEALNWHSLHGDETLVTLSDNKVCKIHVPIVSKDQDLIFGIITYNETWYDTNPIIYVDDTLYYLSPLISGRYGFSLQGRGQYRYARGIYIPKEVIKKLTTDSQGNKIKDSDGIEYIPIIIDQSKESVALHIRGMYTEAVQPYIKPII